MSVNHFSSDIPDTLWWTHQQSQSILMEHPSSSSSTPPNPSSSWYYPIYPTVHRFNLNQNDEDDDDEDNNNTRPPLEEQTTTTEIPTSHEGADEETKEHMFEKPLTPSDVGKLNRLVIPKQHAEKYFPLGGGDSAESKGLLLSFEDETGKCWRFRYSYWNSSQSYVLTKGWSRYVKEKRLDAGDVVLFERHRGDAQRLFIGWRRRQQSGSTPVYVSRPVIGDSNSNSNNSSNGMGVGVGWTRGFYPAHPYPAHHQPLPYQPSADCLHAGGGGAQDPSQTTTAVGNNSRVLRLFGVNMEWQPDESGPSRPESSCLSSRHGPATHQFYRHQPSYSPNPHNNMDVNQMRNRRG